MKKIVGVFKSMALSIINEGQGKRYYEEDYNFPLEAPNQDCARSIVTSFHPFNIKEEPIDWLVSRAAIA